MSYIAVEENLLTSKHGINPEETRINQNQGRGMSGKKHSPESKEAISKTQKARYNLLRMAVEKATNEDRIREVVKEEIQKLINESKPVNNKHNNIPL
jgi:hypothetical protein